MPDDDELLRLTASVVSAHILHTPARLEDVTSAIAAVFAALKSANIPVVTAVECRPEPAVPIKKSVFPDYLVCLEDGKKMTMLKRHLATSYSLTPDQYREKWSLPRDYPMVAPNYAEKRSGLAKAAGLGQIRQKQASAPASMPSDQAPEQVVAEIKRGRGRPRNPARALTAAASASAAH